MDSIPTTPVSPFTLRKLGIGPIQNYSSDPTAIDSIRDAIKNELTGKIQYDDSTVLERLRVDEADSEVVRQCFDSLFMGIGGEAIQALQMLESGATSQPGPVSEKKRERDMYPHLAKIFGYIQDTTAAVLKCSNLRSFCQSKGTLLPDNPHTFSFPSITPDFTITKAGAVSRKWSDIDAFCEIKPTKIQGPKPSGDPNTPKPEVIREVVPQGGYYARLHMSARPFILFSVGIFICGSEFCAGIYDRNGVTFSPIKNMWTDSKDFIRLVVSMISVLFPVDLGHDPSVKELPPDVAKRINNDGYTSYMIPPVGNDTREWCTVGYPIWSSLSLLGRGTVIWRVLHYIAGSVPDRRTERILKTTWRHPDRTPEATIYAHIKGDKPPGLAKYLAGGDVRAHPQGPVITVYYLRHRSPKERDGTPVLHRLLLNSIGRPLWDYKTELELLKGVRAAILAHEFLDGQGIMHRDISAGNILLAKDPKAAPVDGEGFLMDLEFASLPSKMSITTEVRPTQEHGQRTTQAAVRTKTIFIERGRSNITGTYLFMAEELLRAIEKNQQVTQTVEHDVESFMIVLIYVVFRHVVINTDVVAERTALEKLFTKAFRHVSVGHIANSRTSDIFSWIEQASTTNRIPFYIYQLFVTFQDDLILLRRMSIRRRAAAFMQNEGHPANIYKKADAIAPVLTHKYLLSYLEMAIAAAEKIA